MVFSDETFEIKPLSGEVRALSEVDIHVMFSPIRLRTALVPPT